MFGPHADFVPFQWLSLLDACTPSRWWFGSHVIVEANDVNDVLGSKVQGSLNHIPIYCRDQMKCIVIFQKFASWILAIVQRLVMVMTSREKGVFLSPQGQSNTVKSTNPSWGQSGRDTSDIDDEIWSNYSDLTRPGPPKGSVLEGKSPYFREI